MVSGEGVSRPVSRLCPVVVSQNHDGGTLIMTSGDRSGGVHRRGFALDLVASGWC